MSRWFCACLLSLGPACGADPQSPPESAADMAPISPGDSDAAADVPRAEPVKAPAPSHPTGAPAAPPPKVPAFRGAQFPPPDFEPPHPRSAEKGDGQWTAFADAAAGDHAASVEPPVMVRSVVHPHKVSKWHRVTVVAIDLARTSLHLVAGTEDPKTSKVKKERRSGLVPKAHLDSVLAVTNGGWKSNHGRYGMRIGDDIFLPPREDACAILLSEDGLVEIGSWARLSERSEAMAAYRQAPPCLVDSGELHEDLVRRQVRRWGGLDPKRKTRRRSSLGIDASGRILFYGFGEEVDAMGLAEGMRHVGARSVALLDINYSWTRFLLVGQTSTDAPRRITSTLVPKMVHRKRGYVEQSMPRDFFYIRLRPSP